MLMVGNAQISIACCSTNAAVLQADFCDEAVVLCHDHGNIRQSLQPHVKDSS
jgi:hypothetical protein